MPEKSDPLDYLRNMENRPGSQFTDQELRRLALAADDLPEGSRHLVKRLLTDLLEFFQERDNRKVRPG